MPGLLFMAIREVIIFIDGSNWYHNSKSLIDKSKRIDFNCLAEFICNRFNLKLKQIRYYNAVPDVSENEEIYYKHLEFLDKLKKDNIVIKTRKLKYIKNLKINYRTY